VGGEAVSSGLQRSPAPSLAAPRGRSHVGPHPAQSLASAWVSTRGWLLFSLAEGRELIRASRQRYRYRCELLRLMRSGPHLIEDIGLSRKHAEREVAKPFWRP
jgi:uncharacterized protein YjiS (DUF1127 family)